MTENTSAAATPAPAASPPQTEEEKQALAARAKEYASEKGRAILKGANTTGDRGLSALGTKLDKAASFVEGKVDGDERFSKVERVTGGLHNAARYLQEHDPESMLSDVDRSVHDHPYRAMGVAFVVGWVVGRLMRSD